MSPDRRPTRTQSRTRLTAAPAGAFVNFSSEAVMTVTTKVAAELVAGKSEDDDFFGQRVVPSELRNYLARLRLLEGVPFSYLVADAELLPRESIRFFYLDRAWTDALIQGALSVGTVNSSDRVQLESLYPRVRDEVDEEERRVRLPGGEAVQQGPAGPVTGFVLRSRAVSGWPGLHVRAYREELGQPDDAAIPESDPRRIKLLRMERLAPAVLLVLFDGIPAVVHIEEPRQGIQFGVRLVPTNDPNRFTSGTRARAADTALDVEADPNKLVPVPFRPGSPGVIDILALDNALINTPGTKIGPVVDAAEFALEMLRFPYRQVFGDPSVGGSPPIGLVFVPSISVAKLRISFEEVFHL
jgi:hypothetical protein